MKAPDVNRARTDEQMPEALKGALELLTSKYDAEEVVAVLASVLFRKSVHAIQKGHYELSTKLDRISRDLGDMEVMRPASECQGRIPRI